MAAICRSGKPKPKPKPSEWVKGKLVGSGSFGSVHLAMNKATGGLFVVKSAHPGAGREALENEIQILQTLNPSPYIVQCLGTEEEEDKGQGQGRNLNVFMEYMAGGTLADVTHKFGGSLDEEVVRVYTREILHGLKHLHRNGIVHCDLKCKNVLLSSTGNIKLADFGCAKKVKDLKKKEEEEEEEGTCVGVGGTPLWMAPEVLRNDTFDVAADIWSLGCTVIEMATGKPPWFGEVSNPMAAMLRIAHGDGIPKFPTNFSKEGLDFLTRCFQRQPNKRCTTEALLGHSFVSSNSTTSCESENEYASSPASVLGVQRFEDTYDLYELESPDGNNMSTNIWQQEDSALGSPRNWITVR